MRVDDKGELIDLLTGLLQSLYLGGTLYTTRNLVSGRRVVVQIRHTQIGVAIPVGRRGRHYSCGAGLGNSLPKRPQTHGPHNISAKDLIHTHGFCGFPGMSNSLTFRIYPHGPNDHWHSGGHPDNEHTQHATRLRATPSSGRKPPKRPARPLFPRTSSAHTSPCMHRHPPSREKSSNDHRQRSPCD